jgi:pectate lyase
MPLKVPPNRRIFQVVASAVMISIVSVEAGPIGFASICRETTGGGEWEAIVVRDAREFQRVVERLDLADKKARDQTPRVIRLTGDLDLSGLANNKPGKVLKQTGIVYPKSHTTIEGPPGGATLRGGTIELKGAENVIIRNLRFRDLWEPDPSGQYDRLGWDYVRISSAGKKPSENVWIDHCDFGRVYDGQLDVVHGSDRVTISHCIFQGEGERHKKGMLIGHSSSENAKRWDIGRLNVTIHHCWFRNLESRCPRLRTGNVHFFNNLLEDVRNATVSVSGGATLVENCVYRECGLLSAYSYAGDSLEKGRGGSIRITGSLDLRKKPDPEKSFRNHPEVFRFNAPAEFEWNDLTKIPYPYPLLPVDQVEEVVRLKAGPR